VEEMGDVARQAGVNPFRPTDIIIGRYLREMGRGRLMAAAPARAGLKWRSTRLGVNLALGSLLA